jgi:hypothetical protein
MSLYRCHDMTTRCRVDWVYQLRAHRCYPVTSDMACVQQDTQTHAGSTARASGAAPARHPARHSAPARHPARHCTGTARHSRARHALHALHCAHRHIHTNAHNPIAIAHKSRITTRCRPTGFGATCMLQGFPCIDQIHTLVHCNSHVLCTSVTGHTRAQTCHRWSRSRHSNVLLHCATATATSGCQCQR